MTLVAFTIATVLYFVPGEGVSVHSHMVSAGEATPAQCAAEVDAILAEFPGVTPIYLECEAKTFTVEEASLNKSGLY